MTNNKPFDTEDLEKEIERVRANLSVQYDKEMILTGVELEAILKERQRLRKEVEKAIDEAINKHPFGCNHNCVSVIEKELKSRLGLNNPKEERE